MMGTGKSKVGQSLAKKLGYDFIDLDHFIEKKMGQKVAEIFASQGEEAFRKLESRILKDLVKEKNLVLALGGGTLLDLNNAHLVREKTIPILLKAKPTTLAKRLRDDVSRPLLTGKNKKLFLTALWNQRARSYYQIDQEVICDQKEPKEIVREILDLLQRDQNRIFVSLGERTYPIYFTHLGFKDLNREIKQVYRGQKIIIVTNDTVAALYLKTIKQVLKKDFELDVISIRDGEEFKTLETVAEIYPQLLKKGADRKTLLLALGGGVVGDICGFIAGTFLRGIDFVQVPTTLLSQVDSSVGGKTGVDLPEGKNLVGVFLQPKLVYIDTSVLRTLDQRQFRCGMAEVIKYGAIWDAEFLDRLKYLHLDLDQGRSDLLAKVVRRCCEIKAEIVAADEFETLGLRSLLNFGHTLGHAIEMVAGFGSILHGEAVAMGMVYAAHLSTQHSSLSECERDSLTKIIQDYGLETKMPKLNKKKLKEALFRDKKRVSSLINFVYLSRLGKAKLIPSSLDKIL